MADDGASENDSLDAEGVGELPISIGQAIRSQAFWSDSEEGGWGEPQPATAEDAVATQQAGPLDWEADQQAMHSLLEMLGATHEKLVLQRRDEVQLVDQLATHLGREMTSLQKAYHVRELGNLITAATDGLPHWKRLRGDSQPRTL